MKTILKEVDGTTYLEGLSGHVLIADERDAVDLVGLCGERNTTRLMLYANNVAEHFFNLKTRLAGHVLQKFATYSIKAVLVLPPDAKQQQGRFHEMALEANRGRHFGVFYDRAQAEAWLVQA